MKYIKTYESMDFTSKITNIKKERQKSIKDAEQKYTFLYNKTIDDYTNKVKECFLYLSDEFPIQLDINNGENNQYVGSQLIIGDLIYYFEVSFQINTTIDDFNLLRETLNRSIDKIKHELNADTDYHFKKRIGSIHYLDINEFYKDLESYINMNTFRKGNPIEITIFIK